MKTHKDLDVWKQAMDLAVEVYRLTSDFPRHELYGLSGQMRRACVSIASNIAEGSARHSKKDYVRFLYCALGSSAELETQLELACRLEYSAEERIRELLSKRVRIAQMLSGVIRRWKK